MDPEEINFWDINRILLGNVPWTFMIECLLRISFLYFLIIFTVRFMGKRSVSGLSRNETAALSAVAAAIGIPMQSPESGLLPALMVATVVLGIVRLFGWWGVRNQEAEQVIQGQANTLVADGRLQWHELEKVLLTKNRLLSELRSKGIDNLGRVERTYMEASGSFTVLQFADKRPGLSIAPSWDLDYFRAQPKSEKYLACVRCGALDFKHQPMGVCDFCKGRRWTEAVES